MTFQSYKGRIDRATLEELSDLARAVENDPKLSGKEKLVLNERIAARAEQIKTGAK